MRVVSVSICRELSSHSVLRGVDPSLVTLSPSQIKHVSRHRNQNCFHSSHFKINNKLKTAERLPQVL